MIVLGILAVLATVAVRSLEPVADQARYDATVRLLEDLRDATVGKASRQNSDGTPILSGHVADTGTMPSGVKEYLLQPADLEANQVFSFDSDRNCIDDPNCDGTDVSLTSGWNGPYLQLAVGQETALDGWGRPLNFDVDADGNIVIWSMGADGDPDDLVEPETAYDADIVAEIPVNAYKGSVRFSLVEFDSDGEKVDPSPDSNANEKLSVLFYGVGANGSEDGSAEEQVLDVQDPFHEHTRLNTTLGAAAARAVLWKDSDGDGEIEFDEIEKLSRVHYFLVVPGTTTPVEMVLR